MTPPISPAIKKSIHYWWIFLLTGIGLIGIGLWIFVSPAEAYLILTVLFAVSMLMTGVLEVIFALTARESLHGWGWTLASGLLDIVIGTYLFAYPTVTMEVLPLILGFWLLFRGFSAIGFAFDMKVHKAANWALLLLISILICILGLMVLAVPVFGLLNIVVWTALSFITAGFFRVVLAFKLKQLNTSGS